MIWGQEGERKQHCPAKPRRALRGRRVGKGK